VVRNVVWFRRRPDFDRMHRSYGSVLVTRKHEGVRV